MKRLSPEKIIISMGVVILLLMGVIAYQWSKPAPAPEVYHSRKVEVKWKTLPPDTVYLPTPEVVEEIPQAIPPQHQPSANCDSLRGQYTYLSQSYFMQRVSRRVLTKDSISITLFDTVSNNMLIGSKAIWNVKYPETTITDSTVIVLPPAPPVPQVYAGGGVGATFKGAGWYARAGLLYRGKNENITGVSLWGNNQLQYGAELQKYWLIRLRKR